MEHEPTSLAEQILFRPGDTCWRTANARQAGFLIDGKNYYAAFAEAVKTARQQVFILGWDIDSRFALIRNEDGTTATLGTILEDALAANPDLHIHILSWDFAFIYLFERESFPTIKWRFATHDRLHFHLDNEVPFGASHHQKIVVIDDVIAFSGGMDLSNSRWDTREHAPDDDRRTSPKGEPYFAVHDIMVGMVGEVAGVLGELCRGRWLRATGIAIDPPKKRNAPSVDFIPEDVTDATMAVSRTEAPYKTYGGFREVERLHVESIRAARKYIYMENQYFSSAVITRELAKRLADDDGPEIILILPQANAGWLEQKTMENLRGKMLSTLQKADVHDRLLMIAPVDVAGGFINVHAKLTVIDDAFIRVGSANLSNRSMGFDTECDISFFDEPAAVSLVDDLLGEHLGVSADAVESERERTGSIIETVHRLNDDSGRHVTDVRVAPDEWVDLFDEEDPLIDPEKPAIIDLAFDDLSVSDASGLINGENTPMAKRKLKILRIIVAMIVLLGLGALWKFGPLSDSLDRETVITMAQQIQGNPWAPLIVIVAFALGSLVVFPVTLMVMGTAAIFPPVSGFIYALTASVLSSILLYGIGRILHHDDLQQLSEGRLAQLQRAVAKRGFVAVALLRMVPVAPFSIINLVAGTTSIKFRDYVFGTILGMTPGILAFTIFTDTLKNMIMNPDLEHILIFVGSVAVITTALGWVHRRLKSRAPVDDRSRNADD